MVTAIELKMFNITERHSIKAINSSAYYTSTIGKNREHKQNNKDTRRNNFKYNTKLVKGPNSNPNKCICAKARCDICRWPKDLLDKGNPQCIYLRTMDPAN